jgi:predicted metalloprotease with PDZ domain
MTFFIRLFLIIGFSTQAFAQDSYKYFIDLTDVKDDKLNIRLTPPSINEEEITFLFPAMVPGTYDVYNFGRFVSNFKALNQNGENMLVEKKDDNTYIIKSAKTIKEISYDVEDSWDTKIKEKIVFEPGGTNIEEGKNFIFNTHGFFGYIKSKTDLKFELEFKKPAGFYASTGLDEIINGEIIDNIKASNYHSLVDSPIMYCLPDTTSISIGSAKILISAYSPNKMITADYIADNLYTLLKAQADYLGGTLPVNKYAFIFYFTDKESLSGAMGALEHSYSSFYFLPEADSSLLAQEIRDVAAHEFFHIVTPLNIHSEEIGNFDFNNPAMSKHLWLYEGLTEYSAHHMQAKGGLIGYDAYFDVIINKMINARENYNDTVPFTKMSKHVLTTYKKEYNNVYEKGALIGMCIDITLLYNSKGQYGTQELMRDLAKKYGKDKSFKDDELFNDIEALTNKDIRLFLDTYVAGSKPLPYKEIFQMVGLNYTDKRITEKITLGGISVGFNPETNRLVVVNTEKLDEFGKKLKFKEGDEIITFNNRKLGMDNMRDILSNYMDNTKKGDPLVIEVLRKDKKGNESIKLLKAKVKPVKVTETDILELSDSANEQQIITRKSWLGLLD